MTGIYGESNVGFVKSFTGFIGVLILVVCTLGLWFGLLFFDNPLIQFNFGYLSMYVSFILVGILFLWLGFWRN